MVFTNKGITQIISYFQGNSPSAPSHIGVGTGSTAADKSDTALESEQARVAISTPTTTDTTISFTGILTATQANGLSVSEAGLLDASSGGNMFSHFTHTGVAKSSSSEVEYGFILKFTN